MSLRTRLAHKRLVEGLEGPGLRLAYWFAGCSIRCPECTNPHLFAKNSGSEIELATLKEEMKIKAPGLEGISLLGGEPLDQPESAEILSRTAQTLGLSVMLFSGYTLEEIQGSSKMRKVLDSVDLLVDGPYLKEERDTSRRWIGSKNQKLYFLSEFYSPTNPVFYESNQLELKYRDGVLEILGFPVLTRKDLLKLEE